MSERQELTLVSGCLAGIGCSHDGKDRVHSQVRELVAQGKAIPVCPEQLGGLTTPRETMELPAGSGEDVLNGTAKVMTKTGVDVTEEFLKGARETAALARLSGIRKAILKARSPACGYKTIYDGSFSRKFKPGHGVTTALLLNEGLEIITEDDL